MSASPEKIAALIDRLRKGNAVYTGDNGALIYAGPDALHSQAADMLTTLRSQLSGMTEETSSGFDVLAHLARQREWSGRTFGPGDRAKGVVDHIRKELNEIEADPTDLSEWIDVVILAFDGAWRAGYTPEQILAQWVGKQAKNEARNWPDWRTMPADKAIEHDRSSEPTHDQP